MKTHQLTVDIVANDDDPNDPLGNIDPTTVDTIPALVQQMER